MSSNDDMNETDVELVMEVECEEKETFHIYLLSFGYGLLAALIIAHLLFRWHWRRRKLSRFRSSQPGDKSFKNKHMRDILKRDFEFIRSLSPDPRLVNKDHAPQEFGECPDGSDVPVHWYRMVAFDAAADFVSVHAASSPHTLPLTDFLNSLDLPSHDALLKDLSTLYRLARYEDGEFGEAMLQAFQESLQQLDEILNRNEGAAVTTPSSLPYLPSPSTPKPALDIQSARMSCSSQDPLLRASSPTPDELDSQKKWPRKHSSQYTESTPTVTGATFKSPRHRIPKSFSDSGKKWGSLKSKFKSSSAPSDSELSVLVPLQLSPGSPLLSPGGVMGQRERGSEERESEEDSRPMLQSGPASAETQV